MAFNLQKVLRALLFSSSQALSIKDVQDIFARFHEQAPAPVENDNEAAFPIEVPVSDDGAPADAGDADADAEGPDETETLPEADESESAPENETDSENDNTPDSDSEAPSLKPAELLSAQTIQGDGGDELAEVDAQSPEDTDAELYQGVPSLITAAQIREAMDAIAEELSASNDIYILVEGPAGYRLMTHPRFARWIRIMRDEPPPVKLSQSSIETLAIVAYRQPVTRSEIESIRGVSAEAGLNKLIERELVYITGRADLPGRPLQYGTTDNFLEFVGVKSLVELPSSDVLSPRQIDAWLQNSTKITPPSDAEMGLPLEEGEGESPNLASVSVNGTDETDGNNSDESLEAVSENDEPQPAGDEAPAEETAVEPEPETAAAADQPVEPEQPPTEETPDEPPPEKPL